MRFEFDPEKSAANLAKHGIDFEAAQALWKDKGLLGLGTSAYDSEERHLIVGRLDGKLWTAVFTRRSDTVRLISVRRARKSEAQAYLSRGI